MSDIVEWLREVGSLGESYGWGRDTIWFHAAAEIESLRAELTTLKEKIAEQEKEIDRLFDEIMYITEGENI